MKKLLTVLAFTALASVSRAESTTLLTGLPADQNHTINTFYNYDSDTQSAWVQIQVGEWSDGDIRWEKDRYINIAGLSYDAASESIVYNNGRQSVVCGTRDFFASYHIRGTGKCVVDLVKGEGRDADAASLVFNVN